MATILTQNFIPFAVDGIGDIVDIPSTVEGAFDVINVQGATWAIGGLVFEVDLAAEDSCFFTTVNTPISIPPGTTNPPFPPVWPYLFSTGDIYGRDHLSTNLKMIRRDDYIFDIAVVLNGVAVDLSNSTLTMTAKWDVIDTDATAQFVLSSPSNGIVITNAVGGLATVTIASTNTTNLPLHTVHLTYDIELVNGTGQRFTVLLGVLTVIPDISHSSP